MEVDSFFSDCPRSENLAQQEQQLANFLKHNIEDGELTHPLVIITSGGTTVPLERRCVRFIDNFSAGTRGALSTESFLQEGYSVIFLTRKGSVQPFTQDLPSQDLMQLLSTCLDVDPAAPNTVVTKKENHEQLAKALRDYKHVMKHNKLLSLEYETIFDYLRLLRSIAKSVSKLGPGVMFYLAAAVSDFYVPWAQLAEHKIQSSDGDLHLRLAKVPKMLGVLTRVWAPDAMVVSFKLETDQSILLNKAAGALSNYGVHAVVANILHTRKDHVLVVSPAHALPGPTGQDSVLLPDCVHVREETVDGQDVRVVSLHRAPSQKHIEVMLARCITRMHGLFCAVADKRRK
mmetsp:Transcript_28855/g.73616  ORF Transcript_28855/g.73616 Transcript_28855/m.73616 type:complete len:346 (-) Transcript_28855:605-1642(-)|eukprot:CAMPEP_0202867500 /NCGR_PEP_ID=MMETSP1391-20130828/9470_1 /ASSEMBLY_ACC=CAM_ASM_000867 /TAXON_ID=1034604 /ORGANISM="Chlamydomonas leiostraca, Strain SAG 11-49" /LENGTH=345 /DNA_ID=CAMNT_0049547549 /DNA_START=109 /DNA_END=1146 /DNA_ORIENTATION=+